MAATPLRVVTPRPRKERKEAAEALHETTLEFLECRDLRHPWKAVGCFYVGSEIHRKLLCDRCGTEATDIWTGRGERIQRKYKYASGYQSKGVRIKPVDVRREVLERVTVYDSEDQLMKSIFRGNRRRA